MESLNKTLYPATSPFPSPTSPWSEDWKTELRTAFTQPRDLLATLGLDPALANPAAGRQFAFLVPRGFARRMKAGDPTDPLLRQVLPLPAELEPQPGYSTDPVGDGKAKRARGLLQKYQGRALLVVTGACALHCRYCFRRHFPYAADCLIHDPDQTALRAIAQDLTIREVVLSGGDPLMVDDAYLASLFASLASLPHVRRIRLHTRLPVVLPSRVTRGLVSLLANCGLPVLVVIHANHARELSCPQVQQALEALKGTGATLLNQSVLLRGVNADPACLAELSEWLFAAGVLPYYLHLLDPVAGARHFEVPDPEARAIMTQLRALLPGYLVPRLVRELAGHGYKQQVA